MVSMHSFVSNSRTAGARLAPPNGADAERKRAALLDATVRNFEREFAGVTGADVAVIHEGGLSKDGSSLASEIIQVGSLQLVHTMGEVGATLPADRKPTRRRDDVRNGDPVHAVDYFMRRADDGKLAETAGSHVYDESDPTIADLSQKKAHNGRVAAAKATLSAWQLVYCDPNDPNNPELRFAAILPYVDGRDPSEVPAANDIARVISEVQAANSDPSRRPVEIEFPLDRFSTPAPYKSL